MQLLVPVLFGKVDLYTGKPEENEISMNTNFLKLKMYMIKSFKDNLKSYSSTFLHKAF